MPTFYAEAGDVLEGKDIPKRLLDTWTNPRHKRLELVAEKPKPAARKRAPAKRKAKAK